MKLNYVFNDKSLLKNALTHSSSVKAKIGSNERLEFLGDRVLSLAISDYLYKHFKNETEGSLAKRHAFLANANTLYEIANKIELSHDITASFSLDKDDLIKQNIKDKNIMADAVEAIIGAIYLDSDFKTAYDVIIDLYGDLLHNQGKPPQDFKTKLQEVSQSKFAKIPEYSVVKITGPDHSPEFTVMVKVNSRQAIATGASKKEAEQKAAEILIKDFI